MVPFLKRALVAIVFIALSCTVSVQAQSKLQIATLLQDMQLMKKEVGQLKLKIELLESDNRKLKESLNAQSVTQQKTVIELNATNKLLDTSLAQIAAREDAIKAELLVELKRQINDLARETQKGLDTLAKVLEHQPQTTNTATFSNDYPENGVAYVVQPGDSLSKIARELNSSVSDIQNANRIQDPSRDLIAGQTIFVPQKQ